MSFIYGVVRPWSLFVGVLLLSATVGCQSQSGDVAQNQYKPVDDEEDRSPVAVKPDAEGSASPTTSLPNSDEMPPVEAPSPAPRSKAKSPASTKGTKDVPAKDPALSGVTGDKVKLLRAYARTQPTGRTEQQKVQNLLAQMEDLLKTADEILATPGAPEAAKIEALQARMGAFQIFVAFKVPDANQGLEAAATDLAAVSDPEMAIQGKVELFRLKVAEVIESKPEDGQLILDAIATMLEQEGKPQMLLQATVGAATQLEQAGYEDEAVKALVLIGDHFAADKDPQVAMVGQELQLSAMLGALQSAEGEEVQPAADAFVAKAEQIAKNGEPRKDALNVLHQVALQLEGTNLEVAHRLYDVLEAEYSGADESLSDNVKTAVSNARARRDLIGKPFAVTGVLVDGQPFDWNDYQGKVVLVDFWATWCVPCLREMSNIKKNYDKFHDQGFEVVGVNLDDELETVESFLGTQKLPWATVVKEVSPDDEERGFSHPTAEKSGVDALPFVVLIGRDGIVKAIHVRGEKLETALTEMLASTDAPDGDETPAKPAAETEVEPTDETP